MLIQISALAFQQNLDEMLNQVQHRQDHVLISKNGRPLAALVDMRLYERICRKRSRFDALSGRLAAGFAGLPMAEGEAEIEAATRYQRASP
jgi:prevent-host-death family protein